MIRELFYSYQDLNISKSEIIKLIGYNSNDIPDHFLMLIDEAVDKLVGVEDINGAFIELNISEIDFDIVYLDRNNLNLGQKLILELEGSDSLFLFICTAGKTVSSLSADINNSENPVLTYIFDLLGSLMVEKVAEKICSEIKTEALRKRKLVTNRYSPGFCEWHLSEQFKLFPYFTDSNINIRLTDSALMDPVKSVSGIVGSGKKVKFRKYNCNLCKQTNCAFRKN